MMEAHYDYRDRSRKRYEQSEKKVKVLEGSKEKEK